MTIIYESKTGFTARYASMLAEQTGLNAFSTSELAKVARDSEIIFLGWISAGHIKGLSKVLNNYTVNVACAVGLGIKPEPDEATFLKNNKLDGKQFFYLRGGYDPSKIKSSTKFLMKMFVKMLKSQKEQTEETKQVVVGVENGCDFVSLDHLQPVIDWVKNNSFCSKENG